MQLGESMDILNALTGSLDIAAECRRMACEHVMAQKEEAVREAILFAGADPSNLADISKRGRFELKGNTELFIFDGKPMIQWVSPIFAQTDGKIIINHPYRKLYH